MAASSENLSLETHKLTDDWTIVLPRHGKKKRNDCRSHMTELQKQEKIWTPVDQQSDPERELKLMQQMQTLIDRLENSRFCNVFFDQMVSPEVINQFHKVLGSEAKMSMVIYGIGSIESYEPPRLQLSLAISMKRRFSWIGDIEVFDPVISLIESKVLAALGCSVLSINEQGRRQALRPTLFFMPHCEAELYDNLLQANWKADLLNLIALFGNSFEAYEQYKTLCRNLITADSRKHISAVRRFTKEYMIDTVSDDYFRAFHGSSWHFFSLDHDADLQIFK